MVVSTQGSLLTVDNSASLEFLRLVTPPTGGGRSIIDRCMTDEHLLETSLLEEMPDEHRPDDEHIAAKLKVNKEFRTRMAASLQRKFKRNFQGGMGPGYTTSDEVWCHFKPTEIELQKWYEEEERGEKRIDKDHAIQGNGLEDEGGKDGNEVGSTQASLSDADEEKTSERKADMKEEVRSHGTQDGSEQHVVESRSRDDGQGESPTYASPGAAADASQSQDPPPQTWLGLKSELRDGPQQS